MIKVGLMDEIPDACFALHVENGIPGKIVVGSRYLTAYSDSYKITVHGKAAHSSTPEEGVDAVYIAASIVTALHGNHFQKSFSDGSGDLKCGNDPRWNSAEHHRG